MQIVIDLDAVHGADKVAAALACAEVRRCIQRGEPVAFLSEILVDSFRRQFVVTFNRRLKRIHGDIQLLGEFLDAVGTDNIALGLQIGVHADDHLHRKDRGRSVLMRIQPAAAMGGKALNVFGILAVPDVNKGVSGLTRGRMQNIVVGLIFTHEPLPAKVDLQEGLASHPEPGTGHALPRKSDLVRLNAGPVKDH